MKILTLIQAGALGLLAILGAYATAQPAPPCTEANPAAQSCEL